MWELRACRRGHEQRAAGRDQLKPLRRMDGRRCATREGAQYEARRHDAAVENPLMLEPETVGGLVTVWTAIADLHVQGIAPAQ